MTNDLESAIAEGAHRTDRITLSAAQWNAPRSEETPAGPSSEALRHADSLDGVDLTAVAEELVASGTSNAESSVSAALAQTPSEGSSPEAERHPLPSTSAAAPSLVDDGAPSGTLAIGSIAEDRAHRQVDSDEVSLKSM